MSVKISKLPLNESDRFLDLVRKTHPKRLRVEQRFNWQMTNNPHLPDKDSPPVYVATDEDNNIIGHFLLIPFSWYFYGQIFDGFWGVDYYVEEKHRGAAGALLAMKVIRGNYPYFTIDPSEVAQKIASTLGAKTIGHLQRSIWFRTSFSSLKLTVNNYLINTFLKRAIPFHLAACNINNFPDLLSSSGQWQFQRLDSLEEWVDYQWPDTLGFSRSPDFVSWRFFNSFIKYFVYRLKDVPEVYFVVRLAKWKGLNILVLVDYRMPHDDDKSWLAILESTKNLAELNRCDGVVTMHSHDLLEPALIKSDFHNNDKPLLIISSAKLNQPDSAVANKNAVFATMADCDIDINFG